MQLSEWTYVALISGWNEETFRWIKLIRKMSEKKRESSRQSQSHQDTCFSTTSSAACYVSSSRLMEAMDFLHVLDLGTAGMVNSSSELHDDFHSLSCCSLLVPDSISSNAEMRFLSLSPVCHCFKPRGTPRQDVKFKCVILGHAFKAFLKRQRVRKLRKTAICRYKNELEPLAFIF